MTPYNKINFKLIEVAIMLHKGVRISAQTSNRSPLSYFADILTKLRKKVCLRTRIKSLFCKMQNFSAACHKINEIHDVATQIPVIRQMVSEIQSYILLKQIKDLIPVKKLQKYDLVRIGREHDGGYVLANNFPGGIAYSFGICDDISFDLDISRQGYSVFMYDHTIDAIPEHPQTLKWKKQGLSHADNDGFCNTLRHYIHVNGHNVTERMILKMDIEGAEWNSLASIDIDILKQFDQIVLEMHFFQDTQFFKNHNNIIIALKKLSASHQCIHVHGNNYSGMLDYCGFSVPEVLETTYVNRRYYDFYDEIQVFPQEIDQKNCPSRQDIFLGTWNY